MNERSMGLPGYAELHCLSCFSFQRGASHPGELVERAWKLGYAGLAITDECSVSGVVRAWTAWKELPPQASGFKLILGSEFLFDGFRLVALARNATGWGNLCEFITAARMDAKKGEYRVSRASSDFSLLADCEILIAPQRLPGEPAWMAEPAQDSIRGQARHDTAGCHPRLEPGSMAACGTTERLVEIARWALDRFGASAWLAVELMQGLDDALWLHLLQQVAHRTGIRLLAAGDVHMHVRSRKALQDVMTAVREGKPVAECGLALQPSAERALRSRLKLASLYPRQLLDNTLEVARRCDFSLESIRYQYPMESVPPGMTPGEALRAFTIDGAARRYPAGVPWKVRRQLVHELRLIAQCRYEMYFLTVHDIVSFARGKRILCQGRGSAANSAVCYCLHITEVDPTRASLLFERFISKERNEPPDIDVDFEHERREEVIQYIYRKYGRDRSAIAAVVATYRTRSAIRDVGKALGIPEQLVDAFAKEHFWFDEQCLQMQRLCERAAQAGVAVDSLQVRQWLELTETLRGFPRHLSQHVGGFVLTQGKLTRLVPVENAAMPDRSIIQWDKDDLDDMGLLKVDVLALGMLTALRRCIDFVSRRRGAEFRLQDIEDRDVATYDMICRADTVGVFQIESRAQMSMLPRLQPRRFYDLVIEVAIVRPGPIQGGMIHPYLKNRDLVRKRGTISYVNEALKPALERTLGVPIFQEQVMQIAMIAAGFSAAQADKLRRSMAAWKRRGGVHQFRQPLIAGMLGNGYSLEFAEGIFQQILGFGEYGFPESHAASFALLAYDSSWLKCHEPECFLAAMLNSQPMGFYSPSQLVQDARRHGVQVFPADVCRSDWDCTLEWPAGAHANGDRPGVRLGLRMIGGLTEAGARRIVQARSQEHFVSSEDMALRSQLDARDMNALAAGDALQSLSGHRRQQVWDARAFVRPTTLLQSAPLHEETLALPPAPEGEEIVFDYAALGLTLRRHPLALLRPRLARMKLQTSSELHDVPNGRRVRACGIVTVRQQPQTANGTIFLTLEDETGPVNVIVWKSLREQQREAVLLSRLLAVEGVWQRDVESGGNVRNLIAHRVRDLSPWLGRLGQQPSRSRDFH